MSEVLYITRPKHLQAKHVAAAKIGGTTHYTTLSAVFSNCSRVKLEKKKRKLMYRIMDI